MKARTLKLYLLSIFIPAFLASIGLFALVLELVDLFTNLWRYLAQEAPLLSVLRIMLLYLPTAFYNGLPIAVLFASSYSLASLYADNELTIIFSSGLSLRNFMLPLFISALLLCLGAFFFNDHVVLSTIRQKNDLSHKLLGQSESLNNPEVSVISRDGAVIYRAQFYDDGGKTLSTVTVVERDASNSPKARTEAALGRWDGHQWVFSTVRRFVKQNDGGWAESDYGSWSGPGIDEAPDSFRSQNRDLSELSVSELRIYSHALQKAGLPFGAALAEWNKRYSFSFTPLVVVLLAGASGGRFRKNILLASLLTSLVSATLYYVVQMITMLLAKTGDLDPRIGAWAALVIFVAAGGLAFSRART